MQVTVITAMMAFTGGILFYLEMSSTVFVVDVVHIWHVFLDDHRIGHIVTVSHLQNTTNDQNSEDIKTRLLQMF